MPTGKFGISIGTTVSPNDVLHVPDWAVNDSPEMPYPWEEGPEREEILDRWVASTGLKSS